MDQLMEIIDGIYPAICKDNDERPSVTTLDTLRNRLQADLRSPHDPGVALLRQCRIGLHASLALAKAIPAGQLRVLDLSENAIDDCAIVALLQAADAHSGLQELYLASNRITADGASEISRAFSQLRQLAVLDLSNDAIGNPGIHHRNTVNGEGMRLFCDNLGRCFSLTSLRLADNQLTDRDAAALAQVLRVNLVLQHLDLNRNRIGSRGVQLLFDALARNRALRYVQLAGNGIGPEVGRSMAAMLASNSTLISLDMAGNSIGPAIPEVSEALINNTSLLILNLFGNGIESDGAQALAQVLAQNPHLIQVNLGSNRFDEAGGLAIARSMLQNQVLNVLDLSANDIRETAAIHLAEALVNNTSLIVLDLSSCKISDDGAVAIASAIGSNPDIELKTLRFRDNFVSNSAGQVIVDELQSNTSITTADFRGNRIEHAKLSRIRQFCKRNLNHIRNQIPKKLKDQIEDLTEVLVRLEDKLSYLKDEKAEVDVAMEQLAAIEEEKMHWRLAQQATRDELNKRLSGETQQLAEIRARLAQKRIEISSSQANFEKQLIAKTEQYECERNLRTKIEGQMAVAKEQVESLKVSFEKTPDEIREEIERVRRDKLKHQTLMTSIRARYNSIQKGYEAGEGIGEYLERARYSLLHPEIQDDNSVP